MAAIGPRHAAIRPLAAGISSMTYDDCVLTLTLTANTPLYVTINP